MAVKRMIRNPFFTNIDIPDEYFCGREKETADIIRLLTNGNNIVLKSPRRTGKSSLIKHVFKQREIVSHYNTMYVDIMGTVDADEFVRNFQNEIFKQRFSIPVKTLENAKNILTHVSIEPVIDPITNIMLPKIGLNPVKSVEMSLDALFGVLERTDKPNIVVFDEFQQIERYPEEMTAILRSHIQQCTNTRFIFSGSEPHMLFSIFQDRNKPFYDSAEPMNLDILPLDTYSRFCIKLFKDFGKEIKQDAIEFIYYLFCGKTYYMQEMMNNMFSLTEKNEAADTELARKVIDQSIERREQDFRDLLNRFPGIKERKLLFCIANEGVATGIQSSEMISKYQLDTPSSIQNAIGNLTNNPKNKRKFHNSLGVVSEIVPNTFKLNDKYLELWLVKDLPTYNYKLENAEMLFRKEKGILNTPPFNIPTIDS